MSKYDIELNLEDRNSLSVLVSRIESNSTVLEFGPANGRMTKYMKEELNCKVYAVEIDTKSAKDAEQYTEKIIIDSIETYSWIEELQGLQFDYIIFADVLEHLYYPEKVIESVKEFLKEDGSILVSIPNISHNAIILGLLKNEFNYSSTGLLDDTHIKFFTKKTFDKLIEKTGYFRSYETAIFINPENTEFGNSYSEVMPEFEEHLRNLPCGEIYQLIYEIKKHKVETVSDYSEKYKVYGKNFTQIFIDQGNVISEENSIKLPVIKNTKIQEFKFELVDKQTIKNLRLDPLNDSCVIEIEKLVLVKKDGKEINLIPNISTNTCSQHGMIYFFEDFDPQIYFVNLDSVIFEDASYLLFKVRYAHIAKDAVYICANQIVKDRDHTLGLLNQEMESKNQVHLLLEDELMRLRNSRSWKITRPFRSLYRLLLRFKIVRFYDDLE